MNGTHLAVLSIRDKLYIASFLLANRLRDFLPNPNKHTDDVLSAAFTSDGQRIITVSKDGTVKRWFTPAAIIQWLKTATIPKLSPEDKENLGIKDSDSD